MPLALSVPAIAASLAYINARTSLWYDILLLNCALTGAGRMWYREKTDRLNLFYILESYAKSASTANRSFVIFEDKRYTYADVYDRILRYGQWFKKEMGVKKGDIVAVDYQNSDTFIFLWFGLWSIGAKPAFLNYNLSGPSLVHCLNAATTQLCIIDPDFQESIGQDVRDQLAGVQFVVHTPEVEAQILSVEAIRAPDSERSEQSLSNMAILIYTSGTTGMPKPAVVSWGKVIVSGSVAHGLIGRGNGDIMYTVSYPTAHMYASLTQSSQCLSITPPPQSSPSAPLSSPGAPRPSAANSPQNTSGTKYASPAQRQSSMSAKHSAIS